MEEILLVDGYNVLHAWSEVDKLRLDSLEDARDKLIETLSDYQGYKGNRIILVFDAHMVKGGKEKQEVNQGILTIYTGEGETADSVIERLVNTYITQGRVYVATSDWEQQRVIFGKGAYRLPARELLAEIKQLREERGVFMQQAQIRRGLLGYRLNPELQAKLEKWRRGKS